MKRWADCERDSGSLMLALLMTMVLTSVGVLLLATTLTQASATRHDQTFTQVLPAADAGIARGLFMLNNSASSQLPPQTNQGTISLSGQTASWYSVAHTPATAPTYYDLIATSTTSSKVVRKLSAVAFQSSRFSQAAFADKSIVFRGGNVSDSYNSATGTLTTTGHGKLGSNGSVTIEGNASADSVTLYDWANNPNSSRCSGGPCSSSGGYTTVNSKYDITSASATQFMTSALASCGSTSAFTTSAVPSHTLPSGTWCASSLNLDVDTTVSGPTVIYVSGNVTMSHHLNINYTNGTEPIPANLQIYMLGNTYDQANHTTVAAAIYAPLATCYGGAQSVVYGSLVCGSISNVGGWTFHYDDALGAIGAGDFRLRDYSEG